MPRIDLSPETIAAIQRALGKEEDPHRSGPTFGELWEHFRRHHRVGEKTYYGYECLWRVHVEPRFGFIHVVALLPTDIAELRAALRDDGYPPSTRNRIVNVLRSLIKHGIRMRLLRYNPIPDCDKEKENNVREVVLTEGTIERIVEYIDGEYCVRHGDHSYLLGTFFLLCVESGLRREEVCRIRWSDVNIAAGTLTISSHTAKGQKGRTAPLMDRSIEWIGKVPRDGAYVFTNPDTGDYYRPDHWEREWRGVRERLGLGDVTIHDLRRTFVTLARRRGVPESVVMKFSGHASSDVFRRYSIVGPEDLTRAKGMIEKGRLQDLAAIAADKRKRKK